LTFTGRSLRKGKFRL
jgi:hypothetical protein